jgi:hypothetical protein
MRTDEGFLDAFRSMVLSVVWLMGALASSMKEHCCGRFLNIGSAWVRDVHREVPLMLANVPQQPSLGLHQSMADDLPMESRPTRLRSERSSPRTAPAFTRTTSVARGSTWRASRAPTATTSR